jgi:hypothetical protein
MPAIINRPYKACLKDLMLIESMRLRTPPEIFNTLHEVDPDAFDNYTLAVSRLSELSSDDLIEVLLLRLNSGVVAGAYIPPTSRREVI